LLPEDVKKKVVWRNKYWLTDEALSTYKRSAGLFGLEMHSPIICIGQGVPAVVCRFYEQSTKGFMWKDIGLNDWLFDMDEPSQLAKLVPTVLAIAKNPKVAKAKAIKARAFVQKRQKETMQIVLKSL
ncbi:MAG: polysaccharide pyruvyl transferase family protein, partial [Pedobacter sp.]